MIRPICKLMSLLALALVIVPSALYFAGLLGQATVTGSALVGTALWFVATPLWMGRELPIDASEVEI